MDKCKYDKTGLKVIAFIAYNKPTIYIRKGYEEEASDFLNGWTQQLNGTISYGSYNDSDFDVLKNYDIESSMTNSLKEQGINTDKIEIVAC